MNLVRSKDDKTGQGTTDIEKNPLRKGIIFLVLEERPRLAYLIFNHFIRSRSKRAPGKDDGDARPRPAVRGLIMTRQYPPDLRKDHGLVEVPIHWLTTNISTNEAQISPTAVTKLNYSMTEFFKGEGPGIVLIDCIEYIITQNSFETILRMIHSWNDRIVGTNNRLVLSLDPYTLSIQQLHLIKRETQEIPTVKG